MNGNNASEDDPSNVQLITFGRRDPMASLERNQRAGSREYDNPWRQSPLYKNGMNESMMSSSERERFLPPVKLDPGWDSVANNVVDKSSSLSQRIQEMERNPPVDRFRVVYIVMMVHGIAILIPWNMFINAKSYFENYKLDQGNQSSEALLDYKTNFMSYIGMASQYPNFIMNLVNIFVQCGGNTLGIRVLSGITITVVMFIVTVVLAMIDTSGWPETFFWITMATAIVINAAVGIYQNSMYGLAAVLPMKYTNAVIFGNNISGTLVAITNIIVLVLAPSKRTSAIYYFVVAIVILMVAFDAYFVTAHSRFYRHYVKLAELKDKESMEKAGGHSNTPFYVILFRSFGRVFKKIYHLMFGVWFVFFITLALFPAVMSDVKPLNIDMDGEYWSAIFCFLCFNFFATIGNLTTEFIKWPNARWVNVLIILRVVFVPLMILGNFRPELRTVPVYITHDAVFIASGFLSSLPSGYCSSLYFENYKLDQGNQSSEALLDYKTNFMSYIGMASQYPNFIMNLVNIFVQCGGNTLGIRVLSGITITVVMFIVTVVLAMIDTSGWPETFFWITMATAIVINAAVGIYQNSMYGLAAVLPMKYTNAVIFGNNISGTLVAITNIIVLVLAPSKRTSAIYYFVVAIVILMVAFDAYFVTAHSRFYRHYVKLAELKDKESMEKAGGHSNTPFYVILFRSFGRVFKKIYHLMFGVWFVFFITLALFPAVMSDVKPLNIDMDGEYWSAIFCFLCFNFFATIGNLTTEFIKWPNARWVNVLIILRVVFVPLMILGNFRPELRTVPVYITHDAVFIASGVLFSFTSGYCSSLVMMYAPKQVAPSDAPIAGMVMALFLVFGILCGVNFSRVWDLIIKLG
ncbi:uncharacterized protein LOC101856304 [Aplysia californica]|uniref:Uncharacterized protein LOC101856304 n=1 Tax=Aplysia californica TaxID=6500 RepID=A0ABM1VT76_APLCA|nr:uncharacterized protein LOC101856304 [Aplysia californica]